MTIEWNSVLLASLLVCLSLTASCGSGESSSAPSVLPIDAQAAFVACERHAEDLASISKTRIFSLDSTELAKGKFTIRLAELEHGASHSRIELTVSEFSQKTETGWSVFLHGHWMRHDGERWAGIYEYFVSEDGYGVELRGAIGYENENQEM